MPSKKKVAVVAEPPVEAETTARKSIAVPRSVPADAKAPAKVPAVKKAPKTVATKSAQKASATKADPKSVPGKTKSSDCSKETEKAAPPKVAAKGTDTKLKEPKEKVEAAVSAKTTAKAPSKANAATKKPLAAKISKLKNAPENAPGPSTDKDEAQPKKKKLTYEAMMLEAVKVLDDKKGSSMQAIKTQITSIYSVNITPESNINLKKGLDKLLEKGQLIRVSGSGLSGSFKLGKTTKPKKLVPPALASTVPDEKPTRVRVDRNTNGKPPAKSKPPAKPQKAPKVEVTTPTTSEEQVLKSLRGLQSVELSSSEEDSISEHPESDEEENCEETESEEDWEETEGEEVQHEQSLFKNVTKLSDIPEATFNRGNLTDSDLVDASDRGDFDSSAGTSDCSGCSDTDESSAGTSDTDESSAGTSDTDESVEHDNTNPDRLMKIKEGLLGAIQIPKISREDVCTGINAVNNLCTIFFQNRFVGTPFKK